MTDVPLSGSTLLVGPSQVGKTATTARALGNWLDRHGTDGVVVLDFAPEVERDGRILGGQLDRFVEIPDDIWHGVLDAHAPRAESDSVDEAVTLARENAEGSRTLFENAPDPRAVFVNDATIPFQHETNDPVLLTDFLEGAACAVLNAFESDELGTENPVSRRERDVLAHLRDSVDRTIDLG